MKLIALCGAPGAGKTEVQRYLVEHYGVRAVDDGHPLRDFAMRHLGLSKWHVTTQEGKASKAVLPGGKTMVVREALGELGNRLEELFGPDVVPDMALAWAARDDDSWRRPLHIHARYCFGSVRRSQGRVYKEAGATVVEIVRPGCECINDFDKYDKSFVDLTINNDSSLAALHERIEYHLGPILRPTSHV